jgi:ABC-2 type transport system ATP-binding protein
VPAVEVTGLTVRYGGADAPPAVDGIDLAADAGEVLVVLGPNGAGKTSTVETLEGYRRPVAGDVRVLGLDPLAEHAALTGRIGVMLQRGGVYPMLGPRRVLDLFARYYPDPRPPDELLDLVGLRAVAGTPWRHLSGGEQQRLSLALALVGRPEVAFLDEPTAGVDPEGRIAVRGVVGGLKEKGVCVLLTTHELAEAEKMADRIIILCFGRIVLEGTPHDLTTGAGAAQPIVTFGAPPGLNTSALAAAVGPGTLVTETAPGRYRVQAAGLPTPAVTAAVATFLAEHGANLTDLVAGRTLEDVYFEAVGGAAAGRADEDRVASTRRGRSGQRKRRGTR